jgi:choline dehydrogenase-like flavoprotein
VRGYTFEFVRGQGAITAAVHGMATGRLGWGEGHHAQYRKLLRRRTGMVAICEDLPEAHNRVTLDPDADGQRRHSGAAAGLHAERELAADAGSFDRPRQRRSCGRRARTDICIDGPLPTNGGWHLMGTARMGTDPERSVVNEWGAAHDVKNLFIVDGSIFVTCGGLNPTSTIQALALYVADQIKQRLGTLFD